MRIFIFLGLLILLDVYAFQTLRTALRRTPKLRRWAYGAYVLLAVLCYGLLLLTGLKILELDRLPNSIFRAFLFANYLSKFIMVFFLFLDDFRRTIQWLARQIGQLVDRTFDMRKSGGKFEGEPISRSEFLAKSSLALAAFPAISTTYGMIVGAHDYRIHHKTIRLPHLPKALDGVRVAQISDIHAGSFFNKTAVRRGIEMVNRQKADLIFFTGDLVNNRASEMKDYFEVFTKIKAPLGVYSSLGNHDYGSYYRWKSEAAEKQNFQDMLELHQRLGWRLLRNENELLRIDGETLGVLGVENWSANPRFPRQGDLQKAWQGTQEAAVKLLLSHDPSHWKAQVLDYKDIDLMFAGHTHGMQFGVEIGDVKWSPAEFAYNEWAGLYEQNGQFLYVNRGFGYIGLPARIGMPPEITVVELKKA